MRRNSTGRLWSQPAFGEVVTVTKPGPKKALRGQDHEGRRTVKHGLKQTLLDQHRHAPSCLFKEQEDMEPTIQQWMCMRDPENKPMCI
eukprot:4860108-Prorocentrum_lima.AAC.1